MIKAIKNICIKDESYITVGVYLIISMVIYINVLVL